MTYPFSTLAAGLALAIAASPVWANTITLNATVDTASDSAAAVNGPLDVLGETGILSAGAGLSDPGPDPLRIESITEAIPESQSHRLFLSGRVPPPQAGDLVRGFGSASEERFFRAEADGDVTLSYSIDAVHDILTDLDPTRNFFGYGLRLTIFGPDIPRTLAYDTLFDTDPLLDQAGATRSLDFDLTAPVEAGDEFSILVSLTGSLGSEAPIPASFEGLLVVDGQWSLSSTGGELTPITGDTPLPAPVPLPGSLPMLAFGGIAFATLRWRRKATG